MASGNEARTFKVTEPAKLAKERGAKKPASFEATIQTPRDFDEFCERFKITPGFARQTILRQMIVDVQDRLRTDPDFPKWDDKTVSKKAQEWFEAAPEPTTREKQREALIESGKAKDKKEADKLLDLMEELNRAIGS